MIASVVHDEGGAVREAEQAPRGRTRTCVGCAAHVPVAEATDLVRLVLGPEPDGAVAVDARGGAFGRGAHVHARPACLERAAKGGLARSTKGKARCVSSEDGARHPLHAGSLARAIQEAMDRRIEGLFAAAVRSRQLAFGADAVTEACQRGEAALVVVACDAAAAAELTEVRRAVAEGRAVAWGDEHRLGRMVILGKARAEDQDAAGVAVVALLSRPIAEALQQAVQIAGACAGAGRAGAAGGSGPRRPTGTAATSVPPKKGGGRARGDTRRGAPAENRSLQGAEDRGERRDREMNAATAEWGLVANVERGA